jgi:hypothetical protein
LCLVPAASAFNQTPRRDKVAEETIRLRNHYAGLVGISSCSEDLPW